MWPKDNRGGENTPKCVKERPEKIMQEVDLVSIKIGFHSENNYIKHLS